MTVSWNALTDVPTKYTVTAQPGNLSVDVSGTATSAILPTTLSGVAYNVGITPSYIGTPATGSVYGKKVIVTGTFNVNVGLNFVQTGWNGIILHLNIQPTTNSNVVVFNNNDGSTWGANSQSATFASLGLSNSSSPSSFLIDFTTPASIKICKLDGTVVVTWANPYTGYTPNSYASQASVNLYVDPVSTTLISPPAALPVPITTDVAPWLWYDAADPTTIRYNSSGTLTEWYNKGTSAGSTNGNITFNSAVINTGENFGNRNALKFVSGNILSPSISIPAKPYGMFIVLDIDPATFTSGTTIYPPAGDISLFVQHNGSNATVAGTFPNVQTTVGFNTSVSSVVGKHMYSIVNSLATTANNVGALDGQTASSLTYNATAANAPTGNTQYIIGPSINTAAGYKGCTVGEVIIIRSEMTATQRMQIEGYLAWKWGLQTQLPATHPFSTANMAMTLGVVNRTRMYVTQPINKSADVPDEWHTSLAVDSTGNLYVGAEKGRYIRKINSAGTTQWTVSTVAGTQISQVGGPTISPVDGDLFVGDTTNNRILRITQSGTASVFATLNAVKATAITPSGDIYAYANGAIFKAPAGSSTFTIYAGATGVSANTDGVGTNARFYITTDRANMVSDNSGTFLYLGHGPLIYKINLSTAEVSTLIGTTSYTGLSTFAIGKDATIGSYVSGLTIDKEGYIYASHYGDSRIRRISPSGACIVISAVSGYTGTEVYGLDTTSVLGYMGICYHTQTNSFFCIKFSDLRIAKIALGTLNQVAGYASVTSIYQSVADAYGNLYVGALLSNSLTKISPLGTTSTFAGSASSGSANGAGTAATFYGPTGIVSDELGNLYVSDFYGNRIRKISPAGLVTTLVSSINSPLGLTMGPDGNIYAATHGNHTIQQITRTGTVSVYAGASGQLGSTDNVTRLSARFNYPCHVAFDNNGIMYIADTGNHRVRKVDASSNVSTFVGNGTTSIIANPHGITFDRDNNMYITEYGGNKISKITPSGTISTVATGFTNPTYCQIDSAQNLWVSDSGTAYMRHVAINMVPSGAVSITGTLTQGQTITANTSALVDIDGFGTFSYVWSASPTVNGVYTTIAGATGATLTLAEAQVGKYIKVRVSYTDGRGTAEAVSAVAVGTVANVNDPATGLAISGTLQRGLTISANLTSLSDPDGNAPPYTYRWASSSLPSSGFVDISGATSSSYTLTLADVNKYIRLTVGYTNSYGAADSAVVVSGTTVYSGNTPVSGTLDISGALTEGTTVRAIANLVDPDGVGALQYTWSSSVAANGTFTVDASGQDLSGITLTYGQTGRYLRVQVSYTDGLGNAENMISSVVGPIAAYPAPNAPTIGSATAGVTSVTLSWSAPASNSPIALASYSIYNANNTFMKSVDANTFSTVVSDLVPGVSQQFRVIAVNSRGLASNASELSVAAVPTAPPVSALSTGQVSEVINVPMSVAGVAAVAKKITPTVAAGGKKEVAYNPEPGVKTTVAVAGLPAEVEKVVVATAAPQNGYTTLKIAAFNASNQSVSNFSAAPITITLNVPGYTAASLIVRTFDEIGGAQRDSTIATRNGDGSYTMTLSHLTYLRVSQNIECFMAGTKILTAVGYKAIEDIKDGELVATADGRALPCKVYITEIDETTKETAPYIIPANTFGPRCPAQELRLSPLHAIQISRGVWQIPKMAASLYNGIRQLPTGSSCTYYHLEMPNYLTDNIVAEGTIVESYGARQLAGRRVEYKFNGSSGGFIRTVHEGRRTVAARR